MIVYNLLVWPWKGQYQFRRRPKYTNNISEASVLSGQKYCKKQKSGSANEGEEKHENDPRKKYAKIYKNMFCES